LVLFAALGESVLGSYVGDATLLGGRVLFAVCGASMQMRIAKSGCFNVLLRIRAFCGR
jgi:hypothetical protein